MRDSYQDFGSGRVWHLRRPGIEHGYVAASDSRRDGLAAGLGPVHTTEGLATVARSDSPKGPLPAPAWPRRCSRHAVSPRLVRVRCHVDAGPGLLRCRRARRRPPGSRLRSVRAAIASPHAGAAGCRRAAESGELLATKAGQGVGVAILYDALGHFGTSKAFFEILRRGVSVCAFNPVNPVRRPRATGASTTTTTARSWSPTRVLEQQFERDLAASVAIEPGAWSRPRYRPALSRTGRPHRGAAAVAVVGPSGSWSVALLARHLRAALRASDSPIAMACLRAH